MVIFSRKRQKSLRKTIEYFSKFPVNVVILDDSRHPLYCHSIFPRIKYVHSPNSINARRKEALRWINTEFVMMVSDDEAILPRGLRKMINVLDQNPQLSSVGGSVLAVWKFGPKDCGYWAYRDSTGKSIEGEGSLQRLEDLNQPKNNLGVSFMYYNLFRVKVIKELLRSTAEMSEKFGIECGEELSILFSLVNGNVKYVKELYWIRNWNRLPKSSPGINRAKSLAVWWRNTATIAERESFMHELSERVPSNQSIKELEHCWEQIMSYAWPFAVSGLLTRRMSILGSVPQAAQKLLRWVSYCAKRFFAPKRIPASSKMVLNELRSAGIGFEESEVQSAIDAIQ